MQSEIKIIDKLPVERWEEYKNLKIESIKDSPIAFSHELEEAINENDDYWKNGIGDSPIKFFAEDNGRLIGLVGGRVYSKKMFSHNAFIETLYVNSEYRGRGIGKLLEENIINKFKENPKVRNILCEVASTQEPSVALQKKLGFEISGIIKDFGYYDGKYIDNIQF
ncbi:MAG: GNAT family N-acetyltransferase, partial [Parcubacteria group bacterium]